MANLNNGQKPSATQRHPPAKIFKMEDSFYEHFVQSKKGKRNVIHSEFLNDKFKENGCFFNLFDILIGSTCK